MRLRHNVVLLNASPLLCGHREPKHLWRCPYRPKGCIHTIAIAKAVKIGTSTLEVWQVELGSRWLISYTPEGS